MHAGLIAGLVYATAWPDVDLPWMFVDGAEIVGNIPVAGIFRETEVPAECTVEELLRDSGKFVDGLMARPPPKPEEAEVCWTKSFKEQAEGTLGPWHTREEMDAKWGAGEWRPIPRFALWQQGHVAWRCIDNGKEGRQNAAATM